MSSSIRVAACATSLKRGVEYAWLYHLSIQPVNKHSHPLFSKYPESLSTPWGEGTKPLVLLLTWDTTHFYLLYL